MGYVWNVLETIGIHAASFRYTEKDTVELIKELGTRCAIPMEVVNANLSRRAEWFAARVIVMRLIDHLEIGAFLQMNTAFGYPELFDSSNGKPSPFVVSWSHTGDYLIAVGARCAIGVDVERSDRRVEPVLERISTVAERVHWDPVALWCAKEAVAKASGLGMRWGLKNFEMLPPEGELWPVKIHTAGPRQLMDPAVRIWRNEGFVFAICTERPLLLEPLTWS